MAQIYPLFPHCCFATLFELFHFHKVHASYLTTPFTIMQQFNLQNMVLYQQNVYFHTSIVTSYVQDNSASVYIMNKL